MTRISNIQKSQQKIKWKKKKKKKKTNHKSLTQGFAEQNPSKILNFHEYNRCSR